VSHFNVHPLLSLFIKVNDESAPEVWLFRVDMEFTGLSKPVDVLIPASQLQSDDQKFIQNIHFILFTVPGYGFDHREIVVRFLTEDRVIFLFARHPKPALGPNCLPF